MNKVTIKDVAREAGVSISAVSKAMNGSPDLSDATKKNILQVVERLNYVPNVNGRNLKAKATKTIGLFLPSMTGRFYGMLTDSILSECERNGYELTAFFDKNPKAATARLLNQQIDGAIVLHPGIDQRYLELIKKHGVPTVFLNREECDANLGSVLFDSYQDGRTVGKYLLSLGHNRFGCIIGPEGYYDSRMRMKGFEDAVRQSGYEISREHIWQGYYAREDSRRVISEYLDKGGQLPGAIFAVNDYSAIGCMEALRQHGIKIPEEVSVMGCDDIDIAEFLTPPLTTVRIPVDSLGRMAVEMVLDIIRNEMQGMVRTLGGNIVIRDSCYVALGKEPEE